jgi:hypothetical protein
MPLTCFCEHNDDAEWYWLEPDDYSVMRAWTRRKRCCSCSRLINAGELVAEVQRIRPPRDDIEEAIYGPEAIYLAPWYLCETCADLFYSLRALGFCAEPGENQRDLVQEYAAMANDHRAPKSRRARDLPPRCRARPRARTG